ncbi:MAG: LysR family transcriptional regulator [Nocardioides sp.]|uniref:LysR family transcriptional regulator n=1 Tax=Nocardioides sp. TaxID=35761 RepID=UPI0039E7247E
MDLRLLRYFVTTVEEGSATRAAQVLHVTQPVLSRQLRELERRLGLRLFEREGRRLRLTRAGEDFHQRAGELLRHADRVERVTRASASGALEQLHLAVPTTTLTDVLAPFIATLDPADPVPILRGLDPRGSLAAIRSGADLVVVHRPPARSLAVRPLAVLPVFAYVRPDDRWATRDSIGLAELVTRPLVVMTEEFRPRMLLEAALDAAGVAYGEILECTNAQVAQALAAAGRGVAVVSDDSRFDLVPLRIDAPAGPILIRLYAAWDPHHHAAAALAAFADRLAAFCVARYGDQVAPAG